RGLELALSQDSSTIGINPKEVYDANFTGAKLSKYINIPEKKITNLILGKDRYFLLKREIDNSVAKKIMNMALPGVRLEKEYKRIYPNGKLASNLLGFTGMDDNNALSGLEFMYNEELLTPTDKDLARGHDIHLTVDSLIQYRLETALGKSFISTQSKRAVGIFMDVHTGKVLAMASFPNFNPNKYSEYPAEATTNWAIRHVYEPGSTMKIFIAMILLNEKLIDLNEKFYCPGYVEFGNSIVRCTEQHGLVDLDEVLQYSCNVGIIKAGKKIPNDLFYKYLKNFKFGEKTGLSNLENRGHFPNIKDWTASTAYYLSIGQGLEVTPLQLVTSAAGIVNGGRIHTPIIVSHITDAYGDVIKRYTPDPSFLGIEESTTKHILRAMTKVVKMGTGRNAYLEDYAIAGKTGTGQKARPGKGYIKGLHSASFLGFFPADNPKIVGLILFDEPGSELHSGGGIAAPVFRNVVENIIPLIDFTEQSNIYNLDNLEEKIPEVNPRVVPNLQGKSLRESIEIAQKFNAKYKIYGSGFCVKQIPEPGEKAKENLNWTLYFE
ncbi:MAG: penicillin-binding protein, partial [Leptospiraceae bacterium]|nr:penicillin-binding protein [Leptospiraceae bacterium]